MAITEDFNSLCLNSELRLPEFKEQKYRNECDRFGFSSFMKEILCQSHENPAFCHWSHGWKWYPVKSASDIGYNRKIASNWPIVVPTLHQKSILIKEGFERVHTAPLPFFIVKKYLESKWKSPKTRISLLLMPNKFSVSSLQEKMTEGALETKSIEKLIISALELGFDEKSIVVCLYNQDNRVMEIQSLLCFYGVRWVSGASPTDRNGLVRMNEIFSMTDALLTSTVGGFIPYASAHGVKIALVEPLEDVFATYRTSKIEHSWYEYGSAEYIKLAFPLNLLKDKKDLRVVESQLVEDYISTPIPSKEWILDVFGWSSITQRRLNYIRWKTNNQWRKFSLLNLIS